MIWKLREVSEAAAEEAARETGLPPAVARALVLRESGGAAARADFLAPRLAGLSDPFALSGMAEAAARVGRAIAEGTPLVVFGDYDVDGVTATALLTRALRELGGRVFPFVPDRLDEGYGLSPEALRRSIEQADADRPPLVVTVDCGTNAGESIAWARRELGVEVVVTDHHEPVQPAVEEAAALVNPKLGGPETAESLAGVGVAFKLVHALVKVTGRGRDPAAASAWLKGFLDLAALGTVADLVPLRGENRILVRHGLRIFRNTRWPGLRALAEVAKIRGEPDSGALAFQLGPRINAAGRIGKPMDALRLLLTDHRPEALALARKLDEVNRRRRLLEQEMAERAFERIDASFDPEKHFALVVADRDWHRGVVGIVASRVARRYHRPAVVLEIDETGRAHGSCRSIEAFDMLDGLRACDALLHQYGGHRMAAGLQIDADRIDEFRRRLNEAARDRLAGIDLAPVLWLDAEVRGEEVDGAFLEAVTRLAPFGEANPEPVWLLRRAKVLDARTVGGVHLRLLLESGSRRLDALAFNRTPEDLPPGGMLDVAFAVKRDHWTGGVVLQLRDLRAVEPF